MTLIARQYPEWKAPSTDGESLVWPAGPELIAQTAANASRLAREESVKLNGVPLAEVRRIVRTFVGHTADAPLVATGHQTELHHPGVWAKNALIDSVATKMSGAAYHLAVDTDAPKHLHLRWPGTNLPISDDPKIDKAAWSGAVAAPTPAHVRELESALATAQAGWDFVPMVGGVLAELKRSALEPVSLPTAITAAMHGLDWELGLRHHALLASPLWASDGFLLFAHAILADAENFARKYNAALADYRQQHGITTTSRPMPDLFVGDEAIETPFWLDDLENETRIRPSLFERGGQFLLELNNGAEFSFCRDCLPETVISDLRKFMHVNRVRLAPRALTLTLFMRLCVADQFVHGIGGGRYDQVTDRLIQSYFGIEPPAFSVTTATLIFPGAVGKPRVCVPCVKQEGHRLKHGLLGSRKRELVGAIASAPRRSIERSNLFLQMQRELTAAVAGGDQMSRWQTRLQQTIESERLEETLFDRELFYAIQPRDRLDALIATYRSAL